MVDWICGDRWGFFEDMGGLLEHCRVSLLWWV